MVSRTVAETVKGSLCFLIDSGGLVVVLIGEIGSFRSAQFNKVSLAEYAICTSPPGKYNRSTRRPILDVKSGTRSLSGQMAGNPITHIDPITGPIRVPSPPITIIETTFSELLIIKNRSVKGIFWTKPPRREPPRPAKHPAKEKAINFVLCGTTMYPDAVNSFSLTANIDLHKPLFLS